jgi:hypothetical protein
MLRRPFFHLASPGERRGFLPAIRFSMKQNYTDLPIGQALWATRAKCDCPEMGAGLNEHVGETLALTESAGGRGD